MLSIAGSAIVYLTTADLEPASAPPPPPAELEDEPARAIAGTSGPNGPG